jgi:hypothetical protein
MSGKGAGQARTVARLEHDQAGTPEEDDPESFDF